MARLVARALRLGRSALIQTGTALGRYRLSYLTPALLSPGPVIIASPPLGLPATLAQLQQRLDTSKEIRSGDWLEADFRGVLLTTPQSWLADRLHRQGRFPQNIPTLIEGADDLEPWTRKQLEATLEPLDWEKLLYCCPQHVELIRDIRAQLTRSILARPQNPYGCCLLDEAEQQLLHTLFAGLATELSSKVARFWQQWQTGEQILWASLARETGNFTLHLSPGEVGTALAPVWTQQPVVLMGSFLDWESEAPTYRQQLGLADILCLKFSPDRQTEHIQLYLPDRLPMPNTPQFQGALVEQVRLLINLSRRPQPIVVLVDDVPLKAQLGAKIAAEFGSRVQVEKRVPASGILVSGWQFWRRHQTQLPTPHLLIIATLPLPSLENPLVAGQVAYYKRQRQDWFRLYLLPTALRELQRAVIPIRDSQGVVALLDNRVNHRSYGSQILNALEPCARINYLDASWFDL
ncbi:MAG: helicase C-terminal domain-containing protein [Cyanophyceae cyanobacterium]